MSFTVQSMLGSQALVSGTDSLGQTGKAIVSTVQWDELKAQKNFSAAKDDFDAAVEEFFAPLVEAAEKAHEAHVAKPQDPAEYVVLTPEVEATPGQQAEIVSLTTDSIILRLIEEDNTDRLVWLDDTHLGVLAV